MDLEGYQEICDKTIQKFDGGSRLSLGSRYCKASKVHGLNKCALFCRIDNLEDIELKVSGLTYYINIDNTVKFCAVSMLRRFSGFGL